MGRFDRRDRVYGKGGTYETLSANKIYTSVSSIRFTSVQESDPIPMSAAVAKKVVAPKKPKPTAVAASVAAQPVGKAAANKKVASAKKGAGGGGDKPEKVKRNKDGLLASQNKFRRDCKRVWAGDISREAPVLCGSFMQWLFVILQKKAVAIARSEDPTATVTPAHFQGALTAHSWIGRSGLIKGRVGGAAPMMFDSKYSQKNE